MVVAFNSDDRDYRLVKEGGEVDRPADIAFIDDKSFILSNFINGTVIRMSVEGVYEGLFATVERPSGLLYIPSSELIAVASQAEDPVVRVYALDGSLSGILSVSSRPRYIALGADDDEILVTTYANTVERLCLPNSSCEMPGQVLSGGTASEAAADVWIARLTPPAWLAPFAWLPPLVGVAALALFAVRRAS